jgi:hypothetical protein
MKLIHAQVAECQRKLDTAKRELREAIADLDVEDELIIQIRERVKEIFSELRELDRKMLRS